MNSSPVISPFFNIAMLILLGEKALLCCSCFTLFSVIGLHRSSHHKLTQRVELGFPEQDKGRQRGEDKDDRTQQAGSTQVDL
jgi:hypothetical protein